MQRNFPGSEISKSDTTEMIVTVLEVSRHWFIFSSMVNCVIGTKSMIKIYFYKYLSLVIFNRAFFTK